MVGINLFRDYFRDYTDQYVLIGGAACDISFGSNDVDFRATKDLDIVLIVEALTVEFAERFWEFIRAGRYINKLRSNSDSIREVSIFSSSKIIVTPRDDNSRAASRHAVVLRAKREMDLVNNRSISPARHASSRASNPGRLTFPVPETPSSTKMPAGLHPGVLRITVW